MDPARSDEAGRVKSPHSPTSPMFSAKYNDDGVTERAPAVDDLTCLARTWFLVIEGVSRGDREEMAGVQLRSSASQ